MLVPQITSRKAQLRAPLSTLQTAWTGFDPYFYSGGSSSAGPAQVENTSYSLGGVECSAQHPGSGGVADIVSVIMPLLSIKNKNTRAGPAEDDPPLYR